MPIRFFVRMVRGFCGLYLLVVLPVLGALAEVIDTRRADAEPSVGSFLILILLMLLIGAALSGVIFIDSRTLKGNEKDGQ